MDNVFAKPKLSVQRNDDTGMTQIVIQDESYTIMEPLLEILQKDQRLAFAGYKIKHCLENEIIVRLKCNPEATAAGISEKDCFQEALRSLLTQLCAVEDLYTATVLTPQ